MSIFVNFWGSSGHFYALTEFSMHLCAQFKFELHAHAPVHINWLKLKSMSLGACLGPIQEMGMNFKHQRTVDCRQNIEMPGFLILGNPKLV